MKIHQISHACHIIEGQNAKIIFDPVFFQFSKTGYELFPKTKVDHAKIGAGNYDAIFISHSHEDHFCLDSLKLFKKTIPVYFYGPLENELHFISALGFKNVHRLELGKKVAIKDLTVECVDNKASLSECGFLTSSKAGKILNLVDCSLTQSQVQKLNRMGPFDLTLFPFQELNQEALCGEDLGAHYDQKAYNERVELASIIRTRYLTPGSCQIRYKRAIWRNFRAFPISRRRFKEDLSNQSSKAHIVDFFPGQTLEITSLKSWKLGSHKLTQLVDKDDSDYEYRPTLKVPELAREVPVFTNKKSFLKAEKVFLNDFAETVSKSKPLKEYNQLFKIKPLIKIEVVGASFKIKPLYLKFSSDHAKFILENKQKPQLHIQIHAEVFVRNILLGAPHVALLDGIRMHGKYKGLTLTTYNNPLLLYFLLTSRTQYRKLAVFGKSKISN